MRGRRAWEGEQGLVAEHTRSAAPPLGSGAPAMPTGSQLAPRQHWPPATRHPPPPPQRTVRSSLLGSPGPAPGRGWGGHTASPVPVLRSRFWKNVHVGIFAGAACEHTCVCTCEHTCGPCPACECTRVQNGAGVWRAGPAPALPSAPRPRGEGGTQPLRASRGLGLRQGRPSLPAGSSGAPQPTRELVGAAKWCWEAGTARDSVQPQSRWPHRGSLVLLGVVCAGDTAVRAARREGAKAHGVWP